MSACSRRATAWRASSAGLEVLASILEDGQAGALLKKRAARQLASIWECRLNQGIEQFAPVLFSLWASRRSLRPIYGTLRGSRELLQVTSGAHPLWFDFLGDQGRIAEA